MWWMDNYGIAQRAPVASVADEVSILALCAQLLVSTQFKLANLWSVGFEN